MKMESLEIQVEGQLTGPALLHGCLLSNLGLAADRKRPAVIICAGGGYRNRSDREAEPIMLQFVAMGCHALILDYSVAPNRFPTSLRELASAVAVVRDHAQEWHVDEKQIVVCGFSAAGHLCCSLGVFWNESFVYEAIGRRPEEIRPDGMILNYPVITGGPFAHEGSMNMLLGEEASESEREFVSLEKRVTEETPKAFIWHTLADESVPVENTLQLASAFRAHGVNFELHIYPVGRHGLALAKEETAGTNEEYIVVQCQSWVSLVETWMEHF